MTRAASCCSLFLSKRLYIKLSWNKASVSGAVLFSLLR